MTQTRPLKTNLFNRNADLLHGPIFKNLFLFMLPILVSNLFQQLYNTVDTMIVGNGLGTLTIAGHTAARKLFSFTSMPLISMANAGSTFVSQNRGAAQPERVRKGMRTMYLCSVVIMAAEVVLMQLFARQLVQLISGSTAPLVLENGARYLMWNAPFYAVLGVLLCTRYALQSLGQKVLPLFSSVIELVGKVIFVLVFIPRYAYNAVILCEPIIWCFMAAYLVAVYRRDAFVYPRKNQ